LAAGRNKTEKNLLGRGGKKKGCGENEFPPRPHHRGNFLVLISYGILLIFAVYFNNGKFK